MASKDQLRQRLAAADIDRMALTERVIDLGSQTVANMLKPKGPRLSIQLDAADMQAKIDAQLAATLCGGLRPAADPVVDSATLLTEAYRLAACAVPTIQPTPLGDIEAEWRSLIGMFDSHNAPFSDGLKFGFRVSQRHDLVLPVDMTINIANTAT